MGGSVRARMRLLAFGWLLVATATGAENIPDEAALGARLYRDGIGIAGLPVQATIGDDVRMDGTQVACARCHRPSGMGTTEGETHAPMVTVEALYRPAGADGRTRPAYNDAALARAIREGTDGAGRSLKAPMPRYALDERETSAVIAYLKTLSSAAAAGVNETDIHFATIVTGEVKPRDRDAMLDTMRLFFAEKNGETRGETRRAAVPRAKRKRSERSYRRWVLHEWRLDGAADRWRKQLEEHYQRQPVFAVIGGISTGSWAPMHAFCEARELPCLLPITDLPALSAPGTRTIYFSRGLALEAETAALHLHATGAAGPVVQIFREEARGLALAHAFRAAWQSLGHEAPVEVTVGENATLRPDLWRALPARDATVLLWLDDADLRRLGESDVPTEAARAYLSASLSAFSALPGQLASRALFTYPYRLPDRAGGFTRESAWLKAKQLDADSRIATKTLFACLVAAEALMRIDRYFSRAYFLERVEHMLDSPLTSLYPRLSFGPGQRFLAKGSYVVGLQTGSPQPVSAWIVP